MEETKYFDKADHEYVSLQEAMAPKFTRDKPEIGHLEDAVMFDEAGHPYLDVKVGDRIVIERYNGILKDRPWLDTKPYYVNDVDQASGKVKLYFEELQQNATDNFLVGLRLGNLYKKMPADGRWDAPPKPKAAPKVFVPVQTTEHGEPVKKGRGRPKGVKNRPKEVIAQEKKMQAEARLAKRAARLVKKKNTKN